MPRQDFIPPTDTLALIPTAQQAKRSQPKRKRAWEKKNPLHSHRIPLALHLEAKKVRDEIEGLAQQFMTTNSNIAAALMSFALGELRAGRLNIKARPNPNGAKMKIDWSVQNEEGWPQPIPQTKKKQPAPVIKPKPLFLGYRWGIDLDKQISAQAAKDDVACGDLLVRLLQHALNAYETGRLHLRAASVVVKQKVSATWQS